MAKKQEPVEIEGANWDKTLTKFVGSKIACICVRYTYRGILSYVGDNHLVLANAMAVERSGPSNADRPVTEDAINGSIIVKYDAIEIVFWPNWVNAPLPSEQGYTANTAN